MRGMLETSYIFNLLAREKTWRENPLHLDPDYNVIDSRRNSNQMLNFSDETVFNKLTRISPNFLCLADFKIGSPDNILQNLKFNNDKKLIFDKNAKKSLKTNKFVCLGLNIFDPKTNTWTLKSAKNGQKNDRIYQINGKNGVNSSAKLSDSLLLADDKSVDQLFDQILKGTNVQKGQDRNKFRLYRQKIVNDLLEDLYKISDFLVANNSKFDFSGASLTICYLPSWFFRFSDEEFKNDQEKSKKIRKRNSETKKLLKKNSTFSNFLNDKNWKNTKLGLVHLNTNDLPLKNFAQNKKENQTDHDSVYAITKMIKILQNKYIEKPTSLCCTNCLCCFGQKNDNLKFIENGTKPSKKLGICLQISGRNLANKDAGTARTITGQKSLSDPYFIIKSGTNKKKNKKKIIYTSEMIDNNLNPNWKMVFLNVDRKKFEKNNGSLFIYVYDYDTTSSDDLIGRCRFGFSEEMRNVELQLFDLKGQFGGNLQVTVMAGCSYSLKG